MNTSDAAKMYLKAPRLSRVSPVTVLLLRANQDRSGNPRRAFVVLGPKGSLIEVLEEGYNGDALLRARWPWFDHHACDRLGLEQSWVVNIDAPYSEIKRLRHRQESSGRVEGYLKSIYSTADRYQRYHAVVQRDPEGERGSGNREGDDPRNVSDVDAGDAARLHEICADFLQANPRDCDLYLGYDVWLTACGHGTGFWNRGLGDLGERLTQACESELGFLEHVFVNTQPSVDDKPTPPVNFDGLPKAA